MALTINASTFVTKRYLTVEDQGVVFVETSFLVRKRRFSYGQIDYILMSPSHVLSFQVGQEVFSLQTKPEKQKHLLAIQKLRESVAQSTVERSVGFPVTQQMGTH